MWTSVSKRRLRLEALASTAALAASAGVFSALQNRGQLAGGDIALPKLLWLCYALLAWFLLPPLLARDGRIQPGLRRLYRVFFWNMAARGGVELAMLYALRNWHPYYGAAHDLLSIGLVAWLLRAAGPPRTPLDKLLSRHTLVVAAMLAAEIGFALYFAANFVTSGERPLYFVPNEERYSAILISTAIAVSCLTLYFPWFLRGWLYGADAS